MPACQPERVRTTLSRHIHGLISQNEGNEEAIHLEQQRRHLQHHPQPEMKRFVRLPGYPFVICQTCRYACVADEAATHLRREHSQITPSERSRIAALVKEIPSIIQDRAELRGFQFPPQQPTRYRLSQHRRVRGSDVTSVGLLSAQPGESKSIVERSMDGRMISAGVATWSSGPNKSANYRGPQEYIANDVSNRGQPANNSRLDETAGYQWCPRRRKKPSSSGLPRFTRRKPSDSRRKCNKSSNPGTTRRSPTDGYSVLGGRSICKG